MKRPIDRIRGKFKEKRGEEGYSVDEFIIAAASFDSTLYTRTVRLRASENGLRVDLRKMRINLKGSSAIYLIPESKLEALMDIMEVEATVEDFQEELESQRGKSESPATRVINKRDRRYY